MLWLLGKAQGDEAGDPSCAGSRASATGQRSADEALLGRVAGAIVPAAAAGVAEGRAGVPVPAAAAVLQHVATTRTQSISVMEEDSLEREAALQAELEEKKRKLVSASRAVNRLKLQMRQTNAQMGLKDLQVTKLQVQVEQLQRLLAEKEIRLQGALDEADAARLIAQSAQPQEPPMVDAPTSDQLDHLTYVTEELTAALKQAAKVEAELRGQIASTIDALRAERDITAHRDAEIASHRTRQDELLGVIEAKDHAMALDRAHMAELRERAARAEIDDRMQQVFAQRGKAQKQWHPHVEV